GALTPVSAAVPFRDHEDVECRAAFRRIMAAQLTQVGLPLMGLPGLTVTTGTVGRIPVGVQLLAGRYREDLLLQAGLSEAASAMPSAELRDTLGYGDYDAKAKAFIV
ncbi:MAG: hypothetical protein ACKOC9_11995, partial [Alphaproteobacteria bacterium]